MQRQDNETNIHQGMLPCNTCIHEPSKKSLGSKWEKKTLGGVYLPSTMKTVYASLYISIYASIMLLYTSIWMDGWKNELMDRWMDRWMEMDLSMGVCVRACVCVWMEVGIN